MVKLTQGQHHVILMLTALIIQTQIRGFCIKAYREKKPFIVSLEHSIDGLNERHGDRNRTLLMRARR